MIHGSWVSQGCGLGALAALFVLTLSPKTHIIAAPSDTTRIVGTCSAVMKALSTHSLRLLGRKTIFYKAFGPFWPYRERQAA